MHTVVPTSQARRGAFPTCCQMALIPTGSEGCPGMPCQLSCIMLYELYICLAAEGGVDGTEQCAERILKPMSWHSESHIVLWMLDTLN